MTYLSPPSFSSPHVPRVGPLYQCTVPSVSFPLSSSLPFSPLPVWSAPGFLLDMHRNVRGVGSSGKDRERTREREREKSKNGLTETEWEQFYWVELERYLRFVEGLMGKRTRVEGEKVVEACGVSEYCEERALFLLMKLNYDIGAARALLESLLEQPEFEEDSFSSDDEEEDECFVCNDGGPLVCCDHQGCRKVYHAKCSGINHVPDGDFICQWHRCSVCNGVAVEGFKCSLCVNSYCDNHLPNELRALAAREDICEFFCAMCASRWKIDSNTAAVDDFAGFKQRLEDFMQRRNTPLEEPRPELDFYKLYRAVTRRFGFSNVVNHVGWRDVLSEMKLGLSPSNAAEMKSYYLRFLYPYERKYFIGSIPCETIKNFWVPTAKERENTKNSQRRVMAASSEISKDKIKKKKIKRKDVAEERVKLTRDERKQRRLLQQAQNLDDPNNEALLRSLDTHVELVAKKRKANNSRTAYLFDGNDASDSRKAVEIPKSIATLEVGRASFIRQFQMLLRSLGMSQLQVAHLCSISQPSLSNFVNQKHVGTPKDDVIYRSLRDWMIRTLKLE